MNVNMFQAGDNVAATDHSDIDKLPVEELPLPPDFVWGGTTASYQVEGAVTQDGRGPSIWDTFTHLEPSRTNNENGDIACDHYNRVSEDVDLMTSFGVDVYRFSISWSRIIPHGGRNDSVNDEGIAFYNRLIDSLLAKNIEPVVTLYHWDAPQGIYDKYGAFLNTAEFKADFERYARVCFSHFGDRVKKWITFNEPYIISIFGHHTGVLAPGRNSSNGGDSRTEPWIVAHTLIVSHASLVQIYASEFQPSQNGTISIVLNSHFYEPWDPDSPIHVDAAQRRQEFYISWFADPIFLAKDYPACMREFLGDRLPQFTDTERTLLHQTAHLNTFYGMNHYSTKFARALPEPPAPDDCTGNIEEGPTNCRGEEAGPVSGMAWLRVAPYGFRKLLNWVWERYQLPIIITENGCPCPGESEMSKEEALDDQFRMRYFGLYLDAISRAVYEDGVQVTGYYAWSLMDNFEWSAGYGPRYGIAHVDRTTLERTPKKSAWYLKKSFDERRSKGKSISWN
ncbi:hypothetical protein N8T08_005244 [Aspergillus melleus]|uniref:Uncharacterized protein n=1 Tax=Aspergillus melleus TaxID=138277 RepID=A0ACC3BGE3_9EURO|nr:hypothetical protein N8T08_005244 [Aspergillus melleus]